MLNNTMMIRVENGSWDENDKMPKARGKVAKTLSIKFS
jgi:hypothetical protein